MAERLQFMLKENPKISGQEDLYRARLESIIDLSHELVGMMRLVEWTGLDRDLIPTALKTDLWQVEPISRSDGFYFAWGGDEFVPSVATAIDDVLVSVEDFPGQIIGTKIFPDIFLRIKLWAVGRQAYEGDVVGHA